MLGQQCSMSEYRSLWLCASINNAHRIVLTDAARLPLTPAVLSGAAQSSPGSCYLPLVLTGMLLRPSALHQ